MVWRRIVWNQFLESPDHVTDDRRSYLRQAGSQIFAPKDCGSPVSYKMAPLALTTPESVILNVMWINHGYFVDKTYSYCQALIAWAIEESNFMLNRERIRVEPPSIIRC